MYNIKREVCKDCKLLTRFYQFVKKTGILIGISDKLKDKSEKYLWNLLSIFDLWKFCQFSIFVH